jgi:hypothetical protein
MSRKWSPAVDVARDRLFDQLQFSGLPAGERWQMIDDFAHQLAEEQRAYAREVGVPLEDGDIVSAGDVIDLIDPRPVSGEEKTR